MSFNFVTAYFELDSSKNDFYFFQFQKLVETGFSIILYLDSKLSSKVDELSKYKNLKVILFDWNNLYLNKIFTNEYFDSCEIPKSGPKDNIRYLTLINSKIYLLTLALNEVASNIDTLVWIDFGIFKITDDIEHFKYNFSRLKKQTNILIPGGFRSKRLLSEDDLIDSVYWRFLGGIIIAPRDQVITLNEANNVELLKLIKNKKMTWEVNIWTNIEYNNPKLIKYFRSDHNKTMFGYYDKKIILISMIKNEEKIIRRCIDSVKKICDAICISDTGSTDSTINVVNDMITELDNKNILPIKLYQNPWIDFGKNRTISYNNTIDYCNELGWDNENTWGLLIDADMKLVIDEKFNKNILEANGYKIIQDTGYLEYQNTRFIKLNGSWKCVGVTHEYWDGPNLGDLSKNLIYIADIGDGGCKDDKLSRDMKLLVKGIEDEPRNGRYHFYLSQTLKDSGRFEEAIKLYQKRIEIGGWDEEVWYSHYMICKCYISLGKPFEAELWGNKAYELRKSRAEPLATLATLFRERGDNYKAYHYYKIGKSIPMSGDFLFIEKNVYINLEYENTILHYYVFPNDKIDGCKVCVNYLNLYNHHEDSILSNIEFYYKRLANEGNLTVLNLPILDNYCSSSPSILQKNEQLLMNIRYVNYRIQTDGSYKMYENDTFSHDNNVITKNAICYLDNNYNITTKITNEKMFKNNSITDIQPFPTRIKGLEDLRLFTFQNKIYYTATSREFSYTNTNRIVMGVYDIDTLSYLNNKVLHPPNETDCEKNWIPINNKDEKILFIYKWHPLQIGELNSSYRLNITITHETPKFFRNYRGSSNVCEYNGQLWCITHGVKFITPRKYYHQIVVLNKETFKVEKYTVPFYFNNFTIEYCVGMLILNNEMVIVFSQNDMNPCLLRIGMDKLTKYFI